MLKKPPFFPLLVLKIFATCTDVPWNGSNGTDDMAVYRCDGERGSFYWNRSMEWLERLRCLRPLRRVIKRVV
jgi:hypothetical protein